MAKVIMAKFRKRTVHTDESVSSGKTACFVHGMWVGGLFGIALQFLVRAATGSNIHGVLLWALFAILMIAAGNRFSADEEEERDEIRE